MMLRTQTPNTWRADRSFPHVLKKLVLLDQLERLSVEAARGASGGAFFASVLARLNVSIKREDALFLGPGGAGKSHLAQAIGQAAIQQGYRVLYRETHVLLDDLAEAVADGTRKEFMESVATVPLLIIDDFGMRKLPLTAAEDLLEIIMRRYERASTSTQ
jgi:DNA replication protein DnaC